jgi:hypothetical protein
MGAEGTNGNHQKAINTGQDKNVFCHAYDYDAWEGLVSVIGA